MNLERLRKLFLGLVGVYSPSGSEGEALALLEAFCSAESCPYGVQPVGEERYNLLLGRPDAPLTLVGHVDTVDAWDLAALGPEELDAGWVKGLGAADMKGGCAAMVEAYLTLREEGRARDLGVALLVGEERDGDGAAAFLREARPGRALVGEPTGLALATSHFGYLEVELSARGRRAHASIPERGENAAEAVLTALNALLRCRDGDPEGLVLSVRHFETTNPGFAVPERAAAWVDVHLPPGRRASEVAEQLRRAAEEGGPAVSIGFPTSQDGFAVGEEDPLVRAWRALGRSATEAFRSHSDAGLFHAAGVPTLLLGPGRLEYAHTEEERVDFAEVVEAAELYGALAGRAGAAHG